MNDNYSKNDDRKLVNRVLASFKYPPISPPPNAPIEIERDLGIKKSDLVGLKAGEQTEVIMARLNMIPDLPAEQKNKFIGILLNVIEKRESYLDDDDSPGEQTEPIKYQSLVDVKPCKVDWLIDGWIPKRGVTLIAGQPGAGKTTLALSLATACSTGGFWGVKSVEKGKVILYCGEDTYPEIIAPNLIAQGADLKMIQRPIAGLNDDGESESFNPGKHMARLQESLRTQKDVKLIILDPALEIASKARDEYRANDIRQALAPVQRLAEIHNLAIVCITHFLKRHNATGSNVLDRVIGSQAWGAVSRMVLGVEQQREGEARVCMRVKSNWGKASGGFYFFIKPENIGDGINGKAIEFGDSIDGKADQVMGNNSTPKDAPKTNVAADWLIQYLAQYPDGVGWNDAIKDAIDDADITKSTLRNARDTLKMMA